MYSTTMIKSYLNTWPEHQESEDRAKALASLATFDHVAAIPRICAQPSLHPLVKTSKTTFSDIEMLVAYDGSSKGTLSSMFRPQLRGTHAFLADLLTHPVTSREVLEQRQAILKQVTAHSSEIGASLEILRAHESDVAWFFSSTNREPEVSSLLDILYFQFFPLTPLNTIPKALTCMNLYQILGSPLVGILSPICYFIVPYFVLKVKLGRLFPISFSAFLRLMLNGMLSGEGMLSKMTGIPGISYVYYAFTLFFYFQGLFNSFEISRLVYKTMNHVISRVNGAVTYMRAASSLLALFPNVGAFWGSQDPLLAPVDYDLELKPAYLPTFLSPGAHLIVHRALCERIATHLPLIHFSYVIDGLHSVMQLPGLCFSEFDRSKDPGTVHFVGVRHPLIANPVKNTVVLDKSIIITGPNAGGKSTLIKACLISCLFTQTLGLACCDRLVMSAPFVHIRSQMMVPDCKGSESLFEAEMMRSKESLDAVESGGDAIVFMDEIFNSTNPVEGIAGAYAIAKKLSEKCKVMITTHFLYLTKLAKTSPYKLLKMNVQEATEARKVSYPYRVAPGISRQYIALTLLKERGFDEALLNDAIEIKNKLMSHT